MKKILKTDAIDFEKKVKKLLNNNLIKEVKPQKGLKAYEIYTRVGKLEIHTESWEDMKGSSVYSIYTRFDDTEKARKLKTCFKIGYSGKCNFHSFNKEEILTNFEMFIDWITVDLQ